jgi:hypothetical protein
MRVFTPNKIGRANRRPACPLDAGRQFESASCAPPFLSAAVAHLWRSVADAAVQESLRYIDEVLTSNGLRRVPNLQVPSSDGSIVHYEGPPTSGCSVSLKDDAVVIVFFEFGHRRPSDEVKHICSLLERDLESHYGAKNVTVNQR